MPIESSKCDGSLNCRVWTCCRARCIERLENFQMIKEVLSVAVRSPLWCSILLVASLLIGLLVVVEVCIVRTLYRGTGRYWLRLCVGRRDARFQSHSLTVRLTALLRTQKEQVRSRKNHPEPWTRQDEHKRQKWKQFYKLIKLDTLTSAPRGVNIFPFHEVHFYECFLLSSVQYVVRVM